nr:FAD-dependent oxidoreductase [Actinomycetota bacterium]
MSHSEEYRRLSFWHDTVPGTLDPQPSLDGDTDVDVAIVGAGLTGMWTAYYLKQADPGLRIAICEREIAGYGASGRNGGWCSALFPASLTKLERMAGREAAVAMYRAMQQTVDEVGAVAAAEGIDCHWAKGGTVIYARTPVQLERAREEIDEARLFGFDESDLRLLSAQEAREMGAVSDVLGGVYTPHCAAIHPARLARGLADVLRSRGVTIYEKTPVRRIEPGRVIAAQGTVTARYVIRATEGYTPGIDGFERAVAPVYSLVIATEPLPEETWEKIGLADRPTFGDLRHLIIYGQRTADGRLVFGGRGAPYHFGSSISPSYDRVPEVFAALRRTLIELFPALGDVAITHTWGG